MAKVIKYVLIIIVVLAIAAAGLYFSGMLPQSEVTPEVTEEEPEYFVSVETTNVFRQNLTSFQESVGELRAGDTAAASAKVGGRVTSVTVKLGDRVSQGQTLVTLDSVDAVNAVNDVMARLDVAATSVKLSEQTVADARLAYNRTRMLYEGEAISRAEYDRAESALTNAVIGLQVSQGQLRQAEISLSTAREALANYTITAPMSGEVASVNIHSGEMAGPQAPLINLVNLDPMKVSVSVSENIIGNISVGAEVSLVVTSMNREITGRVTSISPMIDNASKAFPIEIAIDNPGGDMRAGMVVRLRLLSGAADNVLALPTDAILERNGIAYVFVLEGDTAREVSIKTGFMSDTMSEITEGLYEGQTVITLGNQLIRDGQKVRTGSTTAPGTADPTSSHNTPVQQTPIQQTFDQQAPYQQAPDQQTPVQQPPIQQTPVQQAPGQEGL